METASCIDFDTVESETGDRIKTKEDYESRWEIVRNYMPASSRLFVQSDESHVIDDQTFVRYVFEELRLIIEWSSGVPHFCELEHAIKTILLKSSHMSIMVLRLAFRSLDQLKHSKFRFTHNKILTREQVVALGWGKPLADGTLKLMAKLHGCRLNYVEFSILASIVLLSPAAPGMAVHYDRVVKMQTKMLEELHNYEIKYSVDGPKRIQKLLLLLPFIHQLGAISTDKYNTLNNDGLIEVDSIYKDSVLDNPEEKSLYSNSVEPKLYFC